SIGIVPITASSIDAAQLLSEADAACYAAKEKGRNRVQVYEPDDMELFERKGEMQWVSRISDALREDRLLLYCQRALPLRPGVAERIEILLRLRSPDGAIVPPMAFIPAAERYGLMPKIDQRAIRNACARLGEFVAANDDTITNINLSGLSLGHKDIARFARSTAAAIVPPMAFTPAAERYGLTPKIGQWVTRNACARLGEFVAANDDTIINISLSGLSLGEKDIARFIGETAAAAGIPPQRLCF